MSPPATTRQAEVAAMFARYGPAYRWWAVLTVMLGTVSAVMEATIANVAMPQIIKVFALGHDRVQLLSTGFLAATTASMLVSQWAIGRYGIRRTYIGALVLLMLFSVLATLSSEFVLLATCRIMQGAIAGLIQPLAMVTLVDVFPLQERGRAMSVYGLGIVLAPAVGPVAGGLLVDHFGWRAVFLVTLPFCALALALAPRYMVRGMAPAGRAEATLDVASLALLGAALSGLLGGLAALLAQPGPALAAIAAGLVLSALFLIRQKRSAHPLLDLDIFRHPGFGWAVLVATAYGMGIYGSTYVAPLYAQSGAGFSASEAGAMLVPGGILLALVLLVSGRLADRFPANRVAMAGLACFALSSLLLGVAAQGGGISASFWSLAALVALGRVGLGLVIPGLNAGALRLLPHGVEPAGAATINFSRQLGGAFGVTLLALFLEWRQRGFESLDAAAGDLRRDLGYGEGFFIIALVYALALLPAWRMTAPQHR